MYILIEEYKYKQSTIENILYGMDTFVDINGNISLNYVGYYYSAEVNDCVFILPKVLLNEQELIFGKYQPEEIINLKIKNPLTKEERDFLYEFAVWIYRAIVVYKKDKNNDTQIICYKHNAQIGNGYKRLNNTYLDILLSLHSFYKNNKNFFLHVIKNIHKGLNKINWSQTIGKQKSFFQNDTPIYIKFVNKKRLINFDEELFIIYFSIINYICDQYGFEKEINCNYQLITGKRFDAFLSGLGKTRLMQIKYKYFSDKSIELWKLCYAFFDESEQLVISSMNKEYLLVKSFYVVFESIIDELIGDKPLPDGMNKKQEDGKIVDHLFTAKSLFENKNKNTYYIGDSKYYKIGHNLSSESIFKQFTYARNVIQWNVDIYNSNRESLFHVKLRDELTEGYNIVPNFFISAKLDSGFNYSIDGLEKTTKRKSHYKIYHVENRLFDRDSLLLFHYDLNFLFILSLYAKNIRGQKEQWKSKIRGKIREDIQKWLQVEFIFFIMKAKNGVDDKWYINTHFKELLGKIYRPFEDDSLYSLALPKSPEFYSDNERLIKKLKDYFIVIECPLDQDPLVILKENC